MTSYVLSILFAFFVSWLVVDAIRIYRNRRSRKTVEPPAEKAHSHNWRKITPFAKQCKDCKTIEVAPTAPEGLEEYLRLMASAKDRKETLLHAEEYKFHDQRTQGWTCPQCQRVIPSLADIPRSPFGVDGKMIPECPYCGVALMERIGSILRAVENVKR